jgi:type III pantothenate kinase
MNTAIVLLSVGNTRSRVALAKGKELQPSSVFDNTAPEAIASAIVALCRDAVSDAETPLPSVVAASVNHPVAGEIEKHLLGQGIDVSRFDRDLAVPMLTTLDDDSGVGMDRLLDAFGAFARSKQACIVVDAGTAVTVDFVDGEGTFHGGAIAPGLRMMLAAMHQHTAALPKIDTDAAEFQQWVPLAGEHGSAELAGERAVAPFGKHTRHAMTIGAISAIRGLTHHLIDRYAEFYGGYPRVVATGGDAALLFEGDELVETIVPDLTLIGMLAAIEKLEELDRDS